METRTDESRPDLEIAWRPSAQYLERSRLLRFMRQHQVADYAALLERANRDPGWFWGAVVDDLDLQWTRPYSAVLDLSRGIQWPRWFVDGGFNYVANCLDRHVLAGNGERTALIWEGEDGEVRRFSYAELLAETCRAAGALAELGVRPGDRVGILMPMIPETAMAVLACGRQGAIYVPIFSGFGPEAAATRLNDAEASLLITADGFWRRGQPVRLKETADAAVALSPSVEKVLVISRLGRDVPWSEGRDVWWHEVMQGQPESRPPHDTDANDPCLLIYTSGTTGRPKGAVHVQAGFPIKAAQDMAHCLDMQADDTLFWLTDLGWMMGPWLIAGTLLLGGTALLFEGPPDFPAPDRLWDLVQRHRVTALGISPTAVRALMSHGEEWVTRHDLSSLRVLGSTGEPWNPAPWRWFFEQVGGGRCPIINYSGGTEISGGLIACTTIHPQKPCSFIGPVPGIAADVADPQGNSVRGVVGELVVRGPWVGMTQGFWKDPQRYLDTYWSRLPDTWVHGDWALIDDDGFWFIQGRSDDTLKIAGKRLGPAEVESAAVAHPAVQEAAAIGVPHAIKGETVVVFCILRPGFSPDDALATQVQDVIARQLGKALKPEAVKFVRELPRTRNAKIIRRLVRGAYLNLPDLGDLTALENPTAIQEIASTRG